MGKKFKMLLFSFSLALSSGVYSDNGEIKNGKNRNCLDPIRTRTVHGYMVI